MAGSVTLKMVSSSVQGVGSSDRVATFAHQFSEANLESAHIRQVARAIIDTVACAVAGCNEKASTIALLYASQRRASQMASAWGQELHLTPEDAAFYNGVTAHVMDFDDVTSPLRGHPSAALLPGLIALAEVHNKSGRELATAYVVGFEVLCKLAKTMGPRHYAKGWHSTSSIGVLAASVACAHLLGLNKEQTINSLGIGVAQAAGSRRNFGSMTKAFQVGHCASAAVRAARLAQIGFSSSKDALDGLYGYMDLYASGESLAEQIQALGREPLEIERSGLEIKKYPSCYATHRVLDGLLDLRAEHALTLEKVARVEVVTSHGALAPLVHSRPQTGTEGKFSMQYVIAAALQDGRIHLDSFSDEAVQRPEIQRFFARIQVNESLGELFPRWAKIRVVVNGGRVFEKQVTTLRGGTDCPLSDAALSKKADDCFQYGRHVNRGRNFASFVLNNFGEIDVNTLLAQGLLRPNDA